MIFIPGLQGWSNLHKSINMIYHVNKGKTAIIQEDHPNMQKKIIDKIQHPFLVRTLIKAGIGGNVHEHIKRTHMTNPQPTPYSTVKS